MTLRFFDSASREIRDFVPVRPGEASVYYCGATVQGEPHAGHVRSAVAFDTLVRWLEYRGYRVTTVRNVTDIDDKILAKSEASRGVTDPAPGQVPDEEWWALAYRYEQAFARAYDALGVRRPTYEPRATGHITEMHALIQRLIDAGHAYPALDDSGDVYFDVRSFPEYGALTRQSVEDMQEAPDADPRGKRDPRDFALWKGRKDGEPESASWPSPWGAGRPGWHLECSAMAGRYLGETFDIHGGGLDLRFPHHENELAQSRAAGDDFARFWMHNGLVTMGGEKMSKSIGNTVSPRELIEAVGPRAVRYAFLAAHYRSVLDYRPATADSPSSVEAAATALARVDAFLAKAGDVEPGAEVPEAFAAAMDDDLSTPQALAALHETVRDGNIALAAGDREGAQRLAASVLAMTRVLGLDDAGSAAGASASRESEALAALVEDVIAQRRAARERKDWAEADRLRDVLAAASVVVEDGAEGSSWSLRA
ncbi:cysteine--tRNA ligase [Falsarthrobacter nasiphocae]|uniref:Cysteine--tRNA ligase n=1 Tax=Falsarthrobacter nasiphocae TaxID=189863 RepID=A0AAE3YH04_9MICC|nr:cysteine--tRNA ligase [Falsarthrobacter nasiphocae]MDR6891763.1 cysteinyl-tRNA synthetase [Falsarthrobacter nasiphocae]